MANINRRDFAAASLATSATLLSGVAEAKNRSGISHDNAAIHQEVGFHAEPSRIYRILTTNEFDKVAQLSLAMTTMKSMHGAAPSTIDAQTGGAFAFFGGYITGRNIELVPDTRLVQAWRAGSWDAGVDSIVRFAVSAQGSDTRLVFDHTGFPAADAPHLAKGWYDNYWTPLTKVLAQ